MVCGIDVYECFTNVHNTASLHNDSSSYSSVNSNFSSFKVLYTNCDCLSQVKKSELEYYQQKELPDVIALTEVFPKNKIFISTWEEYEI